MRRRQREDLAAERAEVHAPRPTGGAAMAGLCGGVVVLLADVAVSGFYGWRVADHPILASALTAGGFIIGAGGYMRLVWRNLKARGVELDRINEEEDVA